MLTLEQIRDASELRLKLRIRAKNLEAVGRRQKAPERIPAIDLRHAGVAIAEQRDGVIVAGDEALPVSGCLRSAGIGTGFQCWLQEAGKSRQDRRDEGNQGDDPIRHTITSFRGKDTTRGSGLQEKWRKEIKKCRKSESPTS